MTPAIFRVESARAGVLGVSTAASARQALKFVREELKAGADLVAITADDGAGALLSALATLEGSSSKGSIVVTKQPGEFPYRFEFVGDCAGLVELLAARASGPMEQLTLAVWESVADPRPRSGRCAIAGGL